MTVPVYQSNLAHEVRYVLDHAGARVVFAEDQEQLSKVQMVRAELARLEHAVLISGKAKEDGFTLAFDRLMERGREVLQANPEVVNERLARVGPRDTATIVYTSGTTGPPKGAVLTHQNLLFQARALAPVMRVDATDETLLFLPLAHIFARVGAMASLELGFTISYAESIDQLLDNLAEVQPTFMFSVPRIYEKVYNKVLAGVQSGSRLKKQLFAYAMAVGRAVSRRKQQGKWVPPHLSLSFQAAEMLVFGKLKRTFGGKIRFFISGGAPLAREIAEFFHAAGMLILEGYGLTETTAASNLNAPRAFRFGTVGKPLPGVKMRIADDGEILLRGDNIFAGYYRREDATAEVMQDGWFCTGDIGTIDADGLLRITDRKKDLIVTSGGKNIAPQNIENLLKTDPIISQVMVYGDKRNYLTALVTLDPDEAASYAEHKEIAWEHISELSRHPQIRDRVDRAIQKKNQKLASYETIKKFAILEGDFEVGEELTPTLKVKRKFTIEKYIDLLEGLYS